MNKQGLGLLTLTFCGLALFGCDNNAYNSSTPGGAGTTPSPATLSNSDLEKRINDKFKADAQLSAADLDIDADASQNTVTLSGKVASQEMRTHAVELAKNAHPGIVVTDKIDVEPRDVPRAEYTEDNARTARERARERGETIGASLDDAWIHTKVVSKLITNADTPQRKINVDVNNNVVTLRGTVETAAQKTEAERVAKDTEGVRRVVNQLKVGAS